MNQELIDFLSGFVTKQRLEQLHRVLNDRTNYITVVLEDIFQPHNASAVIRTCDCFGIQNVHIIENQNKYQINPEVVMGSNKWLTLNYHNRKKQNTLDAIGYLKEDGYRIVGTSPRLHTTKLEEFDLNKGKVALFFGTELTGISDIVKENADEFVKIPMFGFTESFNISVSTSIILHHLTYLLHQSDIAWRLNAIDKQQVMLQWLKKSIKKSDMLERKFQSMNLDSSD
ncbi:TrmH family RNA methyltransferase [Marinilabiliaceae bacterium JC017]|nr:TrmH family RNA methyltransferase [Marinilabiliaceae bacterium JC017]